MAPIRYGSAFQPVNQKLKKNIYLVPSELEKNGIYDAVLLH
jgi:hypothetical protein